MFAIVDIETCGAKFAYQKGRIIDICILIHDGISVVDKFSTLINPDCYISGFFTNISGITNEMVQDAPRFHEVAKDILAFTEGKIFVAHNVSFDYNFVKEEFASLGYKYKRDTLCTVKLSRKLMPGKKSYSLGNLCESIGIEIFNRHRAEGDAIATAKLFDILLQLKSQNPTYKSASVAQIMSTRIDAIKKYILNKLPDSCGVYYFYNKEGNIIYIGKSINMYSRAMSHFNTDIKKMKTMLNELTNVDFVETGSELISLLKESEEIKKHKPIYNKKSKVDVFTHSIIHFENEKGISNFEIVDYDEDRPALLSFTNYSAARERLEKWMDEKELCLKYCGLASETSVCFNHQIKKCRGICAEQEPITEYNARAKQLLQAILFSQKDFMILDIGRSPEEKSFVWIRNYQFHGFGYIDESAQIFNQDDLYEFTHSKTYYPDCDDIVRSWLKTKRAKIVVF